EPGQYVARDDAALCACAQVPPDSLGLQGRNRVPGERMNFPDLTADLPNASPSFRHGKTVPVAYEGGCGNVRLNQEVARNQPAGRIHHENARNMDSVAQPVHGRAFPLELNGVRQRRYLDYVIAHAIDGTVAAAGQAVHAGRGRKEIEMCDEPCDVLVHLL